MTGIHWREPLWLLVALQPWLFIIIAILIRRMNRYQYADVVLLPWVMAQRAGSLRFRDRLSFISLVLAWLCFAIALAGPRTAKSIYDSGEQHYPDVMIVMDLSRSMSARDISPSRIERARLEVTDLVNYAERIRLGIVVYAARPHLLIPPTTDKTVLKHYIKNLRTELLPTEGSDLQAAMRFAASKLTTDQQKPRALLLVTDGEQSLSAADQRQLLQVAGEISADGIRIFALGVGTEAGSPLLTRKSGWLRDNEVTVTSQLESNVLKEIVNTGAGRYATVADSDQDWQQLYFTGLASLADKARSETSGTIIEWQEHYPLWLLSGMLLFLFAHLQRASVILHARSLLLLPAILLLSGYVTQDSYAAQTASMDDAYHAYQQQQYQQAQQYYAGIEGYAARMGEGSSAYRLEQYDLAVQAFILAVLDAANDRQRATALFNLANSYVKRGDFVNAASVYSDVLRYDPDNKAAMVNRGYALALQQQPMNNGEPRRTSRSGRGPGTAPATENLDLSRSGVTLGDEQRAVDRTLPADIDTRPATASALAGQMHRLQATVTDSTEFDDRTWVYDHTDINSINAYLDRIEVDESIFWQRLYEGEEDFSAPQAEPNILPGIKPW